MNALPGSLMEMLLAWRDAGRESGAEPLAIAEPPAIEEPKPSPRIDADALTALLVRSADAVRTDEAAAVAAWDEAGRGHDVETLDEVLRRLTHWKLLGFLGAGRRKRLLASARAAMRRTRDVNSLRLAAAFLGELGDSEDALNLEVLARHPTFVLHGATALSNLRHWHGRAALLRVLASSSGEARVTVIDRLLPHHRETAVRVALVRDAIVGLSPEHAAEVAGDIASACRARELVDDEDMPQDLRDGARAVLRAAE